MPGKDIHPEEQGLFGAWQQATQEETPLEDHFYLQYNPGAGAWELWEWGTAEHSKKASFYDGDEHKSPLAQRFLKHLYAEEHPRYAALTAAELAVHVEKCNAELQARLEQE